MPLVQLDLTEEEAKRVDRLAKTLFRTRRSQVMALLHIALPLAEAETTEAESAAKTQAEEGK